jgi:hypothetical protein
VYSAKLTGQSNIKTIPFFENGQRVYKGEGTVEFISYWPYAHTPDFVGATGTNSGKKLSSYNAFLNKEEWSEASGLTNSVAVGANPGQIPAHFILTKTGTTSANTTFKVATSVITVTTQTTDLQWDSKTGIVSGLVNGVRKPVPYTGDSLGTIPVGGTSTLQLNGGTLDYDYWYY